MRRTNRVAAAIVACLLSVTSCGVGSEDEPQLIEDSTEHRPPETPSFDAETSPETSTETRPAATSPATRPSTSPGSPQVTGEGPRPTA